MIVATMMVSAAIAGGYLAIILAVPPQELPIRIDRRDRRR